MPGGHALAQLLQPSLQRTAVGQRQVAGRGEAALDAQQGAQLVLRVEAEDAALLLPQVILKEADPEGMRLQALHLVAHGC